MTSRREAMLEQVREGGLLARRAPLVAMLSGGRDSVCLLDLAVRPARAGGGDGAARQLRAARRLRRGRAPLRGALRAARGGAGGRAAAPSRGPGNLQAWARDTRYAAAARLAAEAGGAAIATGHTADDQVETILYRLASSPSRRALLGMRPARRQPGAAAARLHPRRRRPRTARSAASPGATTRANEEPAYARNRIRRGLLPGAGRGPPGGRPQRPAHGRAAARRGRGCSTRWSTPSSTAPAATPPIATGHTARRPGRDDPLPARLLARAGGRCWGCGPRDGRLARPAARASPASETTAYCEERGLRLARRRQQRRARLRPQPRAARPAPGAGRDPSRRRRRTSCARRRCCATRPRCSTRWSHAELDGCDGARPRDDRAGAPRRAAPGPAPAGPPAPRRRRRRPAGRRRRPPRRGGRRAAPQRHAMLDLGAAVRARAASTRRAVRSRTAILRARASAAHI